MHHIESREPGIELNLQMRCSCSVHKAAISSYIAALKKSVLCYRFEGQKVEKIFFIIFFYIYSIYLLYVMRCK